MKKVREQYLKLAQKYHPDSGGQQAANPDDDAKFIKAKESFDRIVVLDKESNGQLFMSLEHIRQSKQAEEAKAQHMQSLKQKIKL